ncbi:MAG: hypothetical protein M3450_02350 [Actinomycetota bacterium]|nr:hypothetical protein [Actinomycetota bacterium]
MTLRDERKGDDYRYLDAYVDWKGALHIDGQDLGPGTAVISSDGEYEWFHTIARRHVRKVVALLDGRRRDDILDLLEEHWTGSRSYELEQRLRESKIPVKCFTWNG